MSVRRFLRGTAKQFDPREPFIKKVGDRNINNLWTGREVGGKGKIAMGVGLAGYAGHQIHTAPLQQLRAEAEIQEPTPLPGTMGDMQEYTPNYINAMNENMPQVDGDLAFALNNLRHGGW